ncbi:MAG: pyridoxamine 5'-phosphate oxidase family protein [Proteobacteria bacterium]|nr:pyridoxamine 5'-phosphate oxidase family protein [Pseudomonadota bacterium]
MGKLTGEMKQIIRNYSAGAVATVNDNGSPSVSPKATFVIINDSCIAFGNIRSPRTRANLIVRPSVEVSFTDILARVAVRVTGQAEVIEKESELGQALVPRFEEYWSDYLSIIKDFIHIKIDNAELIRSPAYDVGLERDELVKYNFEKLGKLRNL